MQGKTNLVVFNKVSHPHGKDGEGERLDNGEVASTRNVFDISETRTQECVVHSIENLPNDSRVKINPEDVCQTISSRCGTGGGNEPMVIHQPTKLCLDMKYIVRRLTPVECERLMVLPDGWTIPKNLEVTDALVEEFREKHDTFKRIMAEYDGSPMPKPTSATQARKWLEKITNPDTCPDAPRYKACGNGWATNQPRWILTRLLSLEGVEW